MIKDLIDIIISYLPLSDAYMLIKDNLYKTRNIINYLDVDFTQISVDEPIENMIYLDEKRLHTSQKDKMDKFSPIKYKSKNFLISGPKLYTEFDNNELGNQYSIYENMIVIKSILDENVSTHKKFWSFLDNIREYIINLVDPYLQNIPEYYPKTLINKLIPLLYSSCKHEVTKQILCKDKVEVFWHFDHTTFFDTQGKCYTREELTNTAFWYIPIFEISSFCFFNWAGDFIVKLKYAIIIK